MRDVCYHFYREPCEGETGTDSSQGNFSGGHVEGMEVGRILMFTVSHNCYCMQSTGDAMQGEMDEWIQDCYQHETER